MTYTSFQELAASRGIFPPAPTHKDQTCRRCGAVLREIPGTNVMVCDGEIENKETKKKEPCGNKILRSRVNPA